MKMHCLSLEQALNFMPEDKVYALRICSTTQKYFPDLVCSDKYLHIARYTFDEDKRSQVEKEIRNYGEPLIPTTLFTENIAKSMIEEFLPFKEETELFLVHCVGGGCRSKAIGKGFNDLFGWKNREETFLNSWGQLSCPHLYKIFMNAGKILER